MNKFGITFLFYAKDHFKKKSLIILAIFFTVTLGGLFALNHFGGGYSDIAVVGNSSEFTVSPQMFEELPNRNFHFINRVEDARSMLDEGSVDEVFVIEGAERPELQVITGSGRADSQMEMLLTQTLMGQHIEMVMSQYDLPMSAVIELSTPMAVTVETTVDMEGAVASDIVNFVLPYTLGMLIMFSGQMVANSVSAEKSNRVMEVMLGKVHPTLTMIAKVLSSFLGMVLPIVAVALGMILAELLGWVEASSVLEAFGEFLTPEALILMGTVLVLGYFCFIFLFTAAGAISSSVESLTTILSPLLYGLMIPMMLPSFMALDHVIKDVLVYVPIVSPFILVQRFLRGYSNHVEVGISLALMVAFIGLALFVSARLYMNGISHTSEKVSMKDLRKLLQK